jgi:hypothetical protein
MAGRSCFVSIMPQGSTRSRRLSLSSAATCTSGCAKSRERAEPAFALIAESLPPRSPPSPLCYPSSARALGAISDTSAETVVAETGATDRNLPSRHFPCRASPPTPHARPQPRPAQRQAEREPDMIRGSMCRQSASVSVVPAEGLPKRSSNAAMARGRLLWRLIWHGGRDASGRRDGPFLVRRVPIVFALII